MNQQTLEADTNTYLASVSDEAEELWKYIGNEDEGIPQDEELAEYFQENGGYFDVITWINNNCLEANSHDLLLATGGPAYGVTLIHGRSPAFWFQDWFTPKKIIQLDGDAFDFYVYIFEYLEELEG